MNRTQPVIAGVVVASVVGLVIAAMATGTVRRLAGVDPASTADTAGEQPAGPTGAGAGPDASGPTPPVPSHDAGDSPVGGQGSPAVFDQAAVSLTNDGGGTAMFSLSKAAPGAGDTGCITVTYNGGSDATVRLYGTTGGTGLDHYLDVTITRGSFPSGTPPFDSCAGFVPDAPDYLGAGAGVVYEGTLAAYPDSYDTGVADPPGAPASWGDGDTHAYQFAVTVADDNAAQGLAASQTFTWEARGEEPPAPSGPVPVVDPTSGPPGTIVTVGSGSDPCDPPGGATGPRVRVWISAPDTGEVLAEVSFPVGADGSWSGTITIPLSAANFSAVDLQASCFDAGGAEAATQAAAAPYRIYTAVRFRVMTPGKIPGAPPSGNPVPGTPVPGAPAPPATPVSAQPRFTG